MGGGRGGHLEYEVVMMGSEDGPCGVYFQVASPRQRIAK